MNLENYIPVPESGCWIWLGKWAKSGYGVGSRPNWSFAHREAYRAAHGDIPQGHFVCHKCDTPACINPAHLYAGTPQQNVADRVKRNRSGGASLPGASNPSAKLTAAQADEIRISTGPVRAVAAQFGVSESTVGHIRSGRRWAK